ncbi:MAG: FtsX-like permease family protein [Clostridiales bacterium]|nr:FtsX-like permease family protein [Clostridiales bacterium]
MSKSLIKSILRSVRSSISRFISIVLIVALGVSFFAGFKATYPDMLETAKKYFKENNLMDIRVQSNLGLTKADVTAISKVDGVEYVMPMRFVDALVLVNGEIETDIDGSQISARAYGISMKMLEEFSKGYDDGSFMNRPTLIEGRYPTRKNECLVDASKLSVPESYKIGNKITLTGDRQNIEGKLNTTEFEIVGIIRSPYYLSFERGNTNIGSGKVGTFIIIPDEAFNTDYYTEVYVTVRGSGNYDPYSDEYFDYIKPVADAIGNIADDRLQERANFLQNELPNKIADGKITLAEKKAQLEEELKEHKETLNLLKDLVDNGSARVAEAWAAFEAEFGPRDELLGTNQEKYNQFIRQYNEGTIKLAQAQQDFNEKSQEYKIKKGLYDETKQKVDANKTIINTATTAIESLNYIINTTETILKTLEETQSSALDQEQIQSIIAVLEDVYPSLYTSIKNLTAQGMMGAAIATIKPYLDEQKAKLAAREKELKAAQQQISAAERELAASAETLAAADRELKAAERQLNIEKTKLENSFSTLLAQGATLTQSQLQLLQIKLEKRQEILNLEMNVQNAPENYEKLKTEIEKAEAKYTKDIQNAEYDIEEAEKLLATIPQAKWSIYDRNDTPGYQGYGETALNIRNLANVFPIFFIIVAILICLTTMTRMVEEERTYMGVLLALGYTEKSIMAKYLLYAAIASTLGSVIGIFTGLYFFPYAIFKAYGIMYSMPPIEITYPVGWIIVSFLIGVGSTILATYIACRKDLMSQPATLMRPKAPRPGRRVFLEKIPAIWNRLSFLSKVTVRNLLRNRRRFFMTVIGIAGCTALLLTGSGLYHSVGSIMHKQYNDGGISDYDFQVVFENPQTPGRVDLFKDFENDPRVESLMLTSMTSVYGTSEKSDKVHDVYLFVPDIPVELGNYIRLINASNKRQYLSLTDEGALVTEKFARDTNIKVGDNAVINTVDGKTVTIPVVGIVENYTFHFVYITPTTYKNLFGEAPEFLYAIGRFSDSVREEAAAAKEGESTQKTMLATDIMKHKTVKSLAFMSDTAKSFSEIISAMLIVVYVIMGSASALALLVLYNLSNININERIRELASIKVLGFYDREVSAYIYRENIVLTALGIFFGLIAGVFMHRIVVSIAEVDAVMFSRDTTFFNYFFAAIVTALFAFIINMIMHKKMKAINMADSLKSVE